MRRFTFAAALLLMSTSAPLVARADCDPTAGGGWHQHTGGGAGARPGCVPLIAGLGGTAGYGTNSLPANDDGSTPVVDLTPAFGATGLQFFGGPFHQVYINNNGNMTFGGQLFTYTPSAFPLGTGSGVMYPMIAPYWADVDTRNRTGITGGLNLLYWDLRAGQMTVTWPEVGYFASHNDRRMSFQMILHNATTCGSGDFDVEFRYNRCEWTTGDASSGTGGFGGTPAQVGFDAHDGTNYVSLPMSLSMSILDVCVSSNVGMPGIYQFAVRGGSVVCPGTGDPCDVPGGMGACQLGVTACSGMAVSCMPIGTASAERCDNIDNDCNGMTDDGSGLCRPSEVCANGVCVPGCFEGTCADGQTCTTDGRCVETACIGVTCPAGQRCSGGTCVGGCSGVVCPHGQQCAGGACIDLCNVLMCDSSSVCQDGMCIPMCPCHACATDEICGADGRCAPAGCDLTTCDPGFYCRAGACIDACLDTDGMGTPAMCPPSFHCEAGNCIENPTMPDAGMGGFIDVGIVFNDAGITMPGDDTGVPSMGADASSGGGDAGRGPRHTSGACGCRVESARSAGAAGWLAALVALALVVRRRRHGGR